MNLNRKRIVLISIIVSIIVIVLTITIFLYFKNNYRVQTIPLDLKVEEGLVGINLDTDKLYFGTILKTGSSKRDISFSNNNTDAYKISFSVSGTLKDWIIISEDNFILNPNKNKSVAIKATVPEDAKIGNYSGKLNVLYKKIGKY